MLQLPTEQSALMPLQEDVLLPVSITAYSDKTFTYVRSISSLHEALTALPALNCCMRERFCQW